MKTTMLIVCLAAMNFYGVSVVYTQDSDYLTIYQNGWVMVQSAVEFELSEGQSTVTITDMPSGLDPGTLIISSAKEGVRIQDTKFLTELETPESLFHTLAGKMVEVTLDENQTVRGRLSNYNDYSMLVIETGNGDIQMIPRHKMLFLRGVAPDAPARIRPVVQLQVEVDRAGRYAFDVQYLASGMTWQAEYTGLLNDDESILSTWPRAVITNNTGVSYSGARVQLLAGSVNRKSSARPQRVNYAAMKSMAPMEEMADAGGPLVTQEAVSDYYRFVAQELVDIPKGGIMTLGLLPAADVKPGRLYVFQYSGQGVGKVQTGFQWTNSSDTGFGVALPSGRFRIQQRQTDGFSVFLGEDNLPSLAVDRQATVMTGISFDIAGTRTLDNQRQLSKRSFSQDITIELTNSRQEEVTVLVKERPQNRNWTIQTSSHSYNKISTTLVEFPVTISAGDSARLIYTIRYDQ
jgi:hypothetical protein